MSCWIGRLTRWAMKTSGSSDTSHAAPSSTSSVSVNPRRRSRASIDVHELARLSKLGRQLLHADAAQVAAVDLDAAAVAGPVRRAACNPRDRRRSRTRRSARARRSPRTTRTGSGHSCRVRRPRTIVGAAPARERVLLQRVAFALVELLRRWLRASATVDRARRSSRSRRLRSRSDVVIQTVAPSGSRVTRGRRRSGGCEDGSSRRARMRRVAAAAGTDRPRARAATTSVLRRRLNASMSACSVKPESVSACGASPSRMRYSSRIQNGRSRPSAPSALTGMVNCSTHQASAAAGVRCADGLGRRSTVRHGESFLPEIVAQREDLPALRRGGCPGPAAAPSRSSSTRTDRPSFSRASGSPLRKLKPGARIFNGVADDGHR